MSDYFICPHCEAKVPPGASACPHCGSDEKTGWSEEADYAHLLPDNDEGTTSSSVRTTGSGILFQISGNKKNTYLTP